MWNLVNRESSTAYVSDSYRQHQIDEAQFHLVSMSLVSTMDDLRSCVRENTK